MMTAIQTISETFYSTMLRSMTTMSVFDINSRPIVAHVDSGFDGELDYWLMGITIHEIPFPFYFPIGPNASRLERLNNKNGKNSLRFIASSAGVDPDLAEQFIEQSKEYFFTLNN